MLASAPLPGLDQPLMNVAKAVSSATFVEAQFARTLAAPAFGVTVGAMRWTPKTNDELAIRSPAGARAAGR